MSMNHWKTAVCVSGSAFLCGVAYKLFKSKIFKNITEDSDSNINEVLFYGAEDEKQTNETGLNNLFCIYYLIMHANKTVEVCVPTLTSSTIVKGLIEVQKKNAKVRVVIHNSDDNNNLTSLNQHGIEVKVINTTERLEHEFLLIDAGEDFEDAVAIMGSLDYETNRVNCNRDNTLLTSETTVLKALKKEFERVWHANAITQS